MQQLYLENDVMNSLYKETVKATSSVFSNILKASHLQEKDFGGGEIIQSLVVTINSMERQSLVVAVAFPFIYLGLTNKGIDIRPSTTQHTRSSATNWWTT